MKIKFEKAVQIFQALDDIVSMYPERKDFTTWAKRFCLVYMNPEIDYYNSLDVEEKEIALESEIDIPMAEIPSSIVPDIPNDYIDVLSEVVKGEIKKRKSKLQEAIHAQAKRQD